MRTYGSVHYCPGDPALIRSDNTVRNETSTIGLQSFSSQSKGLLKHSAARHCSLSLLLSPSFFPLFLLPSTRFFQLCLFVTLIFTTISVFLFLSASSNSSHSSFVKARGKHEYHTQTLSRPLHSNITAARFFSSQMNHSMSFFSLDSKQW